MIDNNFKIFLFVFCSFIVSACTTATNYSHCPVGAGARRVVKEISFDYNSAVLSKKEKKRIKYIANRAKASTKICVIGNIEAKGSLGYNKKIAVSRTNEVARELVKNGILGDLLFVSVQAPQFEASLFGAIRPLEEKRTVGIVFSK